MLCVVGSYSLQTFMAEVVMVLVCRVLCGPLDLLWSWCHVALMEISYSCVILPQYSLRKCQELSPWPYFVSLSGLIGVKACAV